LNNKLLVELDGYIAIKLCFMLLH